MDKPITSEREQRFKNVIANRQVDFTVILENVHDPHNIGAVLRSCDAVGVSEIFVMYTEDSENMIAQHIGRNSSSGARKWVKAHFFDSVEACFNEVRKKYNKIYGTHLSTESVSLYDLNLVQPCALMFGNEQLGISDEARKYLDGNFIIPQYGMVQSLNISVACAVSLFEASRQRSAAHKYDASFDRSNAVHTQMYDEYLVKHYEQRKG